MLCLFPPNRCAFSCNQIIKKKKTNSHKTEKRRQSIKKKKNRVNICKIMSRLQCANTPETQLYKREYFRGQQCRFFEKYFQTKRITVI